MMYNYQIKGILRPTQLIDFRNVVSGGILRVQTKYTSRLDIDSRLYVGTLRSLEPVYDAVSNRVETLYETG